MPPPIKLRLIAHMPVWAELAEEEGARLRDAVAPMALVVHHIGSTAVPGLVAKPIIDLLAVAPDLAALDAARPRIEALGFFWHGEYGIPGRRYCKRDDPATGERLVQLHCFEEGSPHILRHLAFRDFLRARPDIAADYADEKRRCADLHPGDSHAYADCKGDWVRRIEVLALDQFAG